MAETMRLFVTGGSGFVGGHIIEQLAPAHSVRGMARSDRSAASIRARGGFPVRCSLDDVGPENLAGIDAVVHCAAFVEEWGTRSQFWSVNVEGTTRLLEAARKAGVKRFIHIGTEAAVFDGRALVDIDESYAYPIRQRFHYSETKAEAERRVLAANGPDFHTLSIRPRLVWGPRDTSVLPAILRMVDNGQWRWLDGGVHQTSTTHVLNLAHGVNLALHRGLGGNAYFVADAERESLRGFITRLVATQGQELPERSISGGIARPVAWLVEGLWRLLRRKSTPPMTRFAVSMMSREVTVRLDKAQRELRYQPVVSVSDGMSELAAEHALQARQEPSEEGQERSLELNHKNGRPASAGRPRLAVDECVTQS